MKLDGWLQILNVYVYLSECMNVRFNDEWISQMAIRLYLAAKFRFKSMVLVWSELIGCFLHYGLFLFWLWRRWWWWWESRFPTIESLWVSLPIALVSNMKHGTSLNTRAVSSWLMWFTRTNRSLFSPFLSLFYSISILNFFMNSSIFSIWSTKHLIDYLIEIQSSTIVLIKKNNYTTWTLIFFVKHWNISLFL